MQHTIGDRFDAKIHSQDGADVWVDHETGKGTQEQVQVIGVVAAPFGMGNGNDAVYVWKFTRRALESFFQLLDKTASAGGCAEEHDIVACANPAAVRTSVAEEGAFLRVARHLIDRLP